MRRIALVALACAGAAVGVLAEQQAFAWRDLSGWLPDLLAGWTLIGLGIVLLALRRPPGAAALLLVAGFTWFAFNFETTGPDELRRLAGEAAYLHRAPLFALAFSLPSGRPRTRLAVAGVAVAWASVLLTPIWDNDWTALLLVGYFVVTATLIRSRATGRRSRTIASRGLAAVTVLGTVIAADAVRSIAGAPQGGLLEATVFGYALAVAATGILLASGAMLAAPASLAERAVALEGTGRTLRDALRDLLGDPRLEVGFATGSGPPVDDLGRALAEPSDGRLVTPVTVAGRRVAVVIHEPATLDDATTRAAVFAAVGLAAERARLRAEVGRQVEAVEASGRRLLLAEDAERVRLADRLERGPGADLADAELLVRAAGSVPSNEALTAALDRACEQLALVRPELDIQAQGLGGIDGDELVLELERLADRVPLATELRLSELSVSSEIASALWFVCSESLTNVAKHAEAQRVRVALSAENGAVRLSVQDDGRGGADPRGSGLAGLADRVEVLGGRLLVEAPPEGGTRIVAELPL